MIHLNSKRSKTILVDLDSLLDTRITTLWLKDPQLAEMALADHYHLRLKDMFQGISQEEFKEAYQQRGRETLRQAMVTPILDLVLDFCHKGHEGSRHTPLQKTTKVEINLYPYQLEDSEANAIVASFVNLTGGVVDIQAVFLSPEDLNPLYVKEHYEVMVMYQYSEWLDTHAKNKLWEKYSCPETTLFVPMLYLNNKQQIPKNPLDDFTTTMDVCQPFVGLTFLPIEMFSIAVKPQGKREQPV